MPRPPQEAQVRLDRGRRQVLSLPHLHHGAQMLLAEVARIGQLLEDGLQVQVANESSKELGALVPRLVRHGLLKRCVQRVEQFQQHLEDLERWSLAGPVPVQDLLRSLARPALPANRLVLSHAPRVSRLLGPAAMAGVRSGARRNLRHELDSEVEYPPPERQAPVAMNVESREAIGRADSVALADAWSCA